jgi:hypothetical protein
VKVYAPQKTCDLKKTSPTDGIWRGEWSHRPGLGLI